MNNPVKKNTRKIVEFLMLYVECDVEYTVTFPADATAEDIAKVIGPMTDQFAVVSNVTVKEEVM